MLRKKIIFFFWGGGGRGEELPSSFSRQNPPCQYNYNYCPTDRIALLKHSIFNNANDQGTVKTIIINNMNLTLLSYSYRP